MTGYRRLRAAVALLTVLCSCSCALPRTRAVEPAARIIAFDTDVFTGAHVDISPDGRTLVFDVLGDLYTVSITGGQARPLTSDRAWDARARFSPDGRRIAFVSDRGGEATVWTIDADGGNPTEYAVTWRGWLNSPIPAWAPDNLLLDVAGREGAAGRELRRLVEPGRGVPFSSIAVDPGILDGGFSGDGRYVFHGGTALRRVDLRTGESVDLGVRTRLGSIDSVRPSSAGDKVAYVVSTYSPATGETCALRLRDVQTGDDRLLSDVPGCSRSDYAFLPDDSAVIINHAGRLTRLEVMTGARSVIPVRVRVNREIDPQLRQVGRSIADGGEVRARAIRWPSLTRDGLRLAYTAFGRVYIASLPGGESRRITDSGDFEFMPALSPDGRWIAYATTSGSGPGHLMVAPADGGTSRQLTATPGRYANPVWSPDGSRIAFLSDETEARFGLVPPITGRHIGNWPLSLQWISLSGGEAHRVLVTSPLVQDTNRFHPVPAFSADGTRIYIGRFISSADYGQPGTYLVSARLDGSDLRPHLRLPDADEVVVAPDGRHIAIASQGCLHIVPLPPVLEGNVPTLDLDAVRPIATDMPAQLSWRDGETLIWSAANVVLSYRLGDASPKRLVDLDVRLPRPTPQGCFALTGARLVTMRADEVIERGAIVVCGNRITAIGRMDTVAIPEGAQRVDASGTTIIPGLMDMHGHLNMRPSEIWQRQDIGYVGSLAHGVTTVYDPAAPTSDVFSRAEMVEAGQVPGPRIYSSGMPIFDEGEGLSRERGFQSLAEARTLVASYARYGAGPLKDYMIGRHDRRRWLVQAAREQGIALTAHPDSFPGALSRIVDGYTALEHDVGLYYLGDAPLQDDVLRFIAASAVNYTRDGLGFYLDWDIDPQDPKLRRLYPAAMMRLEGNFPIAEALRDARTLARLDALGGSLTISAHGNGIPGLALHQEMWALVVHGGMSTHAALRVATSNGARKLNMEQDLGSLEPGKVADFIVLNANPLENIRNSTDIRWVVANGFLYDAPTMTRLWPDRRELLPWPWQSEEERRRLAPPERPRLSPAR